MTARKEKATDRIWARTQSSLLESDGGEPQGSRSQMCQSEKRCRGRQKGSSVWYLSMLSTPEILFTPRSSTALSSGLPTSRMQELRPHIEYRLTLLDAIMVEGNLADAKGGDAVSGQPRHQKGENV